MTYAMADIHGNYEKYESMLRLISLSDEDELYILGDAIDRGTEGIRILKDIMERPNVHMLMGNHELMAIETILAATWVTTEENEDSLHVKILRYFVEHPEKAIEGGICKERGYTAEDVVKRITYRRDDNVSTTFEFHRVPI